MHYQRYTPDWQHNQNLCFRNDWLTQRGFHADKLIAIHVEGDSMEPGLFDGDTVVINTQDTTPRDGDVFAVHYQGEEVIQRMVRQDGTWWLSSDNPDQGRFPKKMYEEEMCRVIGRVVHKQSEKI